MGYKILRSHSREEFFIALATGLLPKSNTEVTNLWSSKIYKGISIVFSGPISRLKTDKPEMDNAKKMHMKDGFGIHPNWVVSYIAYTKFHSPRPVFHLPGQIFTHIGERVSTSFPDWLVMEVEYK